ncbi:MAG: hypothetical protein H0W88_05125 [Parachlamydiaceae bacterium]|nr:hypothetical protein [Parachlamydiaceae bacterium]
MEYSNPIDQMVPVDHYDLDIVIKESISDDPTKDLSGQTNHCAVTQGCNGTRGDCSTLNWCGP